jgi:hypothetical protein
MRKTKETKGGGEKGEGDDTFILHPDRLLPRVHVRGSSLRQNGFVRRRFVERVSLPPFTGVREREIGSEVRNEEDEKGSRKVV